MDVLKTKKGIKTLKGWNESGCNDIYDFLVVGDEVDEELYLYFLNILPPTTWTSNILQVGAPASCIDRKPTFLTFETKGEKITYLGDCLKTYSQNNAC